MNHAHVDLRDIASRAFLAAVAACDARRAVIERVDVREDRLTIGDVRVDLSTVDEVRLAALGKAATSMASGFAELLGSGAWSNIARRGLVVTHAPFPDGAIPWPSVRGDHPVPGPKSFAAGRSLLELCRGCDHRTLFVVLLSGGASALAEWPIEGIQNADIVRANQVLLRADLVIRIVNAVRKRLSAIKGGGLAHAAAPARVVTLVVSDVPPGDVQSVGSGPTLADDTAGLELRPLLSRAGAWEPLPPRVRRLLERARPPEATNPPRDVVVLLDSSTAASAAAGYLSERGVASLILRDADGPLRDVADRHLRALGELAVPGVRAVVSAGEVTVNVTGGGTGGRNQETVLYSLLRARDLVPSARELVVLSAGTDGRDGLTDAAGAVADLSILETAAGAGLDPREYLQNNDSFGFLAPRDALVHTGPTGTNVRDVRIYLAR